jgi:hypothetical protein
MAMIEPAPMRNANMPRPTPRPIASVFDLCEESGVDDPVAPIA